MEYPMAQDWLPKEIPVDPLFALQFAYLMVNFH